MALPSNAVGEPGRFGLLNWALTGKMEMPKASEQKEFANVSLWAMPSFRKS
ncbi:hypothetical protein ASZ79_03210 [Vibrio cholerae]|nr:hypothetical protein ASZ79_03210 [Vibrio cholerae]